MGSDAQIEGVFRVQVRHNESEWGRNLDKPVDEIARTVEVSGRKRIMAQKPNRIFYGNRFYVIPAGDTKYVNHVQIRYVRIDKALEMHTERDIVQDKE